MFMMAWLKKIFSGCNHEYEIIDRVTSPYDVIYIQECKLCKKIKSTRII